jgi:hypothetical protein
VLPAAAARSRVALVIGQRSDSARAYKSTARARSPSRVDGRRPRSRGGERGRGGSVWSCVPSMENGRRPGVVVAIECVAGGSRAEEWGPGSSEMVQTGDVVEELLIGVGGRGGPAAHAAPFKGGRAALQKLLHAAYKRGDTSVEVRVRRPAQRQQLVDGGGGELVATAARMQACIVPHESVGVGIGRSRQYVLRSIRDPNYAVGLVDRMESECIAIRGNRHTHRTAIILVPDRGSSVHAEKVLDIFFRNV